MDLRAVLSKIDQDALRDSATDLLQSGLAERDAVEFIASALDALFPFDSLFGGPAGQALERADRAVFRALARIFVVGPARARIQATAKTVKVSP